MKSSNQAMPTLEYSFYQENFCTEPFKYKTYGCGKWAKTYEEAHHEAKVAVLKMCMEENPHLANIKPVTAPKLTHDKIIELNSEHSIPENINQHPFSTEQANKPIHALTEVESTINEIMRSETTEQLKKEFWLLSKSNLKYSEAYNQRLKQLKDGSTKK